MGFGVEVERLVVEAVLLVGLVWVWFWEPVLWM
jgi:hypothetical protein